MTPGPPPEPTALRLLRGNPGKRPINDREPQPQRGVPKRPAWLPKRARRYWPSACRTLDDMGVLSLADANAVALMCDALAEYVEATSAVEEHGMTYESATQTGYIIRRRPEVEIAASAWLRFAAMAKEFGLTASSRTKLKIANGETEVDPFEELRNRGRSGSA